LLCAFSTFTRYLNLSSEELWKANKVKCTATQRGIISSTRFLYKRFTEFIAYSGRSPSTSIKPPSNRGPTTRFQISIPTPPPTTHAYACCVWKIQGWLSLTLCQLSLLFATVVVILHLVFASLSRLCLRTAALGRNTLYMVLGSMMIQIEGLRATVRSISFDGQTWD
jgi:hypothetical protein